MPAMDDLGEDVGDAEVIRETDKALMVRLRDFKDKEVWVPKSQIHADSEVWKSGDSGVLVVSRWLKQKMEL